MQDPLRGRVEIAHPAEIVVADITQLIADSLAVQPSHITVADCPASRRAKLTVDFTLDESVRSVCRTSADLAAKLGADLTLRQKLKHLFPYSKQRSCAFSCHDPALRDAFETLTGTTVFHQLDTALRFVMNKMQAQELRSVTSESVLRIVAESLVAVKPPPPKEYHLRAKTADASTETPVGGDCNAWTEGCLEGPYKEAVEQIERLTALCNSLRDELACTRKHTTRLEEAVFSAIDLEGEALDSSACIVRRASALTQLREQQLVTLQKLLDQSRHSMDRIERPWRVRCEQAERDLRERTMQLVAAMNAMKQSKS